MNYFDIHSLVNYLSRISGLGLITSFFALCVIILCVYIITYLHALNRRASKFERWKFLVDTLIRNAIFFEEETSSTSLHSLLKVLEVDAFQIPDRVNKLLKNPHFRNLLLKELIAAKQNMSGTAARNLQHLFRQLELNYDVVKLVKNNLWHLKATGIQYLGIMEMVEHKNLVLGYTNHKRRLIRVEAQNTIVKFSGFEGLRFLDQAPFALTEWQQIKLLEELSQLPAENFKGIDNWLRSDNKSVVIFALKLARNYFRFELYENVKSCLNHPDPEVRRQAILTIKELQTAESAEDLLRFYDSETERNKLEIILVLEDVGSEIEVPFLMRVLDLEGNKLKLAAAKAVAVIGETGIEQLATYPEANEYPYKEIFRQVKAEKK